MGYYTGQIKVVADQPSGRPGRMCFAVDKDTLEPVACSIYDVTPWAEPDAIEVIDYWAWMDRRDMLRKTPNDKFRGPQREDNER